MVISAGNIRPVHIEEEMRTSYLSYAMSVIVSRALPDVRDGLKPVQRRILYALHDLGLRSNSPYKKCARIVGEVLGKYHPHGDSPVYEALVRMAQDFSLRHPLIDGQGNFGSVDDDPPAAMRYTEARLASIAEELLADIDLDTVDFATNFDDSLQEPLVLPGRLPNMLVNGASGIAVGMATNIPPHNLGEISDACIHLIEHPDATVDELMNFIPGPDFPTGAIIQGQSGIVDAYTTGHGRVILQARAVVEELRGGRYQVVISELPYQVNKATLVERIAQQARDRRIEGITDVRDESGRDGLRVVVELRRDAQPQVVLNNLYKHTAMRSSFNVIMLALVDGQPQTLPLKRTLQLFIEHRQRVVTRRSEHLLKRAQDRAHIVEGLRMALSQLDQVVTLIRGSSDADAARAALMEWLNLSQAQAQAILEMQLRRLAALERKRLDDEYTDLRKTIQGLEALLAHPAKVLAVIREETEALKKRFSNPRRTEISPVEAIDHTVEELTLQQDVVITFTSRDYIKRIPCSTYKLQHRGGKGVRGMTTRDGDSLQKLVVADTHDVLLFLTSRGRVYQLKCFQVPGDNSRTSRGVPLVNLLPLLPGEKVSAIVAISSLRAEDCLLLATKKGQVKAMDLKQLANIRSKGLAAMNLKRDDELVSACLVRGRPDVVVVTERGQAIRFPVDQLPKRSRAAGGVRGIRLAHGDRVVSMDTALATDTLLVASKGGYGKSTGLSYYRGQARGGVGLRTFRVSSKTGPIVTALVVSDEPDQELFLVSAQAQVIRINLANIRITGRNTQGVIVWRDRDPDDYIVSLAQFLNDEKSSQNNEGPAQSEGQQTVSTNGANGEHPLDPETLIEE